MNGLAMTNLVVDADTNLTSHILTQPALITHGCVMELLIVTMNRMKSIASVRMMNFNAVIANVAKNVKNG